MEKTKYCKCGCGGKIIIKPHHKYVGIPDYLHGHNPSTISEEALKKFVAFNKGRKWSKESRLKASLSHIGEKHTKSRIKKRTDKIRGLKRSKEFCKANSKLHKGKTVSLTTRIKMSLIKTGDKYFTGFKSYKASIDYHSKEYKTWRQLVFKRDNWVCQNKNCPYCGNKKGAEIQAHHKLFRKFCYRNKWNELIYNISNGITYCKPYHLNTGLHKTVKNVKLILEKKDIEQLINKRFPNNKEINGLPESMEVFIEIDELSIQSNKQTITTPEPVKPVVLDSSGNIDANASGLTLENGGVTTPGKAMKKIRGRLPTF